ncbi:MAG: glutamine--fructose-6-phosphate transaminase (isomerizing) [Bombilactobacillus mellifer]|uniref:glutamine--fructose-6-phosphate transaminase (isomerizing) n=1 Tax=Bombilactobacillus mellifer TaxID=1218492 RepID=UPI0023F3D010|nr:glutamine--fructose-6-phosphate transaminase (isomerizing) [Bombilactobacillus mellifer]MCT6844320.1 glutamine--fructose-6-phosphate transaminase (isomerizing) [Bombilactobacillus mellifer]MCT6895006.1 glutamine--fructose-6-phosphate transaminase (isomerizing) [Bombilactobacillus mellifer]
MCGIVGVVGNPQTTSILINGLKKLEYRGYDSAGIYVTDEQGHDILKKRVGKIANLQQALDTNDQGLAGIGQTRWATHGKPTEANAHPHFSEDKRFYIVHNGVITNFNELKQKYLSDVHFASDTDTEVIVQLIAYFAQQDNSSTLTALQKTLSLLNGSYAFALMDRQEPDKLWVAKNKSPLLIGLGDHFNVVCSDAMAMLDQTHKYLEIHDGEIGVISKEQVQILTLDGQAVQRDPYTVAMDATDISKGTYDSYMSKEIDEQPAVLRRIAKEYYRDQQPVISPDLIAEMKQADRIYIVAAGTSYHAGLVGQELFEELANVPAEVKLASEFGHHLGKLSQRPFFIFLTQSGETADSRQVLVQTKALKYPSLTVTNVANSTLAREADYALLLHAGPEIAVASTKAYTAQIAVQAILAQALGQALNYQPKHPIDVLNQLGLAANAIQTVIDQKDKLEKLTEDYFDKHDRAFFIGRGNGYMVALEAALKLKEVSYIHAEGFAAGELKHGTIALIENQTPVVAFILEEATAAHTRGNVKEVVSRGAHTLTIAKKSLAQSDDTIVLDDLNELLMPLVAIIPGQLFAYFAAKHRGNDVDQPRNLAKSVTVE